MQHSGYTTTQFTKCSSCYFQDPTGIIQSHHDIINSVFYAVLHIQWLFGDSQFLLLSPFTFFTWFVCLRKWQDLINSHYPDVWEYKLLISSSSFCGTAPSLYSENHSRNSTGHPPLTLEQAEPSDASRLQRRYFITQLGNPDKGNDGKTDNAITHFWSFWQFVHFKLHLPGLSIPSRLPLKIWLEPDSPTIVLSSLSSSRAR